MRILAALGAICVFLAFLASPGGAEVVRWPMIDPASTSTPMPRVKPDNPPGRALPEDISVVRQCAGSTMYAKVVDPDGTRVFYAEYSRAAFDDMVGQGCTMVQQGCNTCRVAYTGCTARQRAACTDGDCLAKICKRQTICTMKACTAYGTKAPPCEARFARHGCVASAFESLDKAAPPRE